MFILSKNSLNKHIILSACFAFFLKPKKNRIKVGIVNSDEKDLIQFHSIFQFDIEISSFCYTEFSMLQVKSVAKINSL